MNGSEWDLTDDQVTILETDGTSKVINFPYRVTVNVNPDGTTDILQNGVIVGTVPAPNVFKEQNRFYVDPNGSDSNTGANEKPVLTITKALTLLGTGDTAVVNE